MIIIFICSFHKITHHWITYCSLFYKINFCITSLFLELIAIILHHLVLGFRVINIFHQYWCLLLITPTIHSTNSNCHNHTGLLPGGWGSPRGIGACKSRIGGAPEFHWEGLNNEARRAERMTSGVCFRPPKAIAFYIFCDAFSAFLRGILS